MAAALDRITLEPGKCGGKPCIRGMRITVRRVLELLATYPERKTLFSEYPFLQPEDLNKHSNMRQLPSMTSERRIEIRSAGAH